MGMGVIPSLFGAKNVFADGAPPYIEGRVLSSVTEVDKLEKNPDPLNGWGAKVKEAGEMFLDYSNGDIPVGYVDIQSPYGVATKLAPNEDLILAMYDEPECVHKLMRISTDAIITFTGAMYKWFGKENVAENPYCPIPNKCGIGLSDDYISVLTPDLHKEFVRPYNIELFERYGAGNLHTCGPQFPGFIDSSIGCKPRSIELPFITRDKLRTKSDYLELRRRTAEAGIVLTGCPPFNETDVFLEQYNRSFVEDEELITALAYGRHINSFGGTREQGLRFMEIMKRVNEKVLPTL